MSSTSVSTTIATIGIDLGKNTFHLVGLDRRGVIVLQMKVSRGQLERRLANVPRCLIGMEACSGSHHIGRQLAALGHDVRLIPARRRWRRGMAAIPLVNLSALFSSMGRDPRLVGAAAGEDRPSDTSELVGERDR